MHNYTITVSGDSARLLRCRPTTDSVVLTTIGDPERARKIAGVLDAEASWGRGGTDLAGRDVRLVADAHRAGSEPAGTRRRMLSAFDTGRNGVLLDEAEWHCAAFGHKLGVLCAGVPDAVSRAVRDEAAALFEGLDDVLVVATLAADRRSWDKVVINDFLESADAEQRANLADPAQGDPTTMFALIDLYYEELRDVVDGVSWDICDLEVDKDQLAAWCARHPLAN